MSGKRIKLLKVVKKTRRNWLGTKGEVLGLRVLGVALEEIKFRAANQGTNKIVQSRRKL